MQGVESFWIHNFPIPVTAFDIISRLCKTFLWAGTKSKVVWIDICKPKEEGGLGLRDSKTWNRAILFKILWDIHLNKDCLWIR